MAPRAGIIALAGALVLLSLVSVVRSNEGGENHNQEATGGGLGGLLGGLSGPLGDLMGGLGGKQDKLGGGGLLGKESELVEKKIVEKEAAKDGFLGIKGPVELGKLLLNPLELIKHIATFFKLEKLGLIEIIGKGLNFGLEVALSPALLSVKIIEKVFVPDSCKLKFVCDLGKPIQAFKGAIPKFTPGFLDGANTLKALSDGIFGQDCEHLYPCGGDLKLKKEFDVLKSPAFNQINKAGESFGHSEGHQGEHFNGEHTFAASNESPASVSKDAPFSTGAQ